MLISAIFLICFYGISLAGSRILQSNQAVPTPFARTTTKLPLLPCTDDYEYCANYAKKSLCSENINRSCRKSCNYCTPNLPCVDDSPAACTDGLRTNPYHCYYPENRANCRKSCRFCESDVQMRRPRWQCYDDLKECPSIAQSGKCWDDVEYGRYYAYQCRKSCNYCTPNIPCEDADHCNNVDIKACEINSYGHSARIECPKKCGACEKNATTISRFIN